MNPDRALIARVEQNLNRTLPDAQVVITEFPELDGIRLGLINDDYQTGPLAPEVMTAVIANPAYWSFCWGSGLAMARWLISNPDIVQGKTVIDLGSGSGVVGIAAALAGARQVIACDNDPNALDATAANASLNGVELQYVADAEALPRDVQMLLMADVLYDRSNFALIELAKQHCQTMIIADSRIADVEDKSFDHFLTLTALTQPNLGEFEEFRTVRFFKWENT